MISHAGFCICCGVPIDWNVNTPFCKLCRSRRLEFDKGPFLYCHGCGRLSKHLSIEHPLCKEGCRPFGRDSAEVDGIYLKRLSRYKVKKDFHAIWDVSSISVRKKVMDFDILDLLQIVELEGLKINVIFENDVSSNKRIMNTLWRWEFGLAVNPPELIHSEGPFWDGRHRVLAAYYLNAKSIPVVIR